MRKKVHFLFLFVLANLVFLGANAQLLLQEGFEGTFPPNGWTLTNSGTGNSWTQNTSVTYAYAGTKSMQYLYNITNAADAWAFTPVLSLTTTPVLITFYLRVRSATFPENFKLTIGNDVVFANHTTVLLDSTGIKNTVFQKWEVIYTPSAAGTYYLGFNCYSAANKWNLFVDNLTVQIFPSCSGKPNAGIASGPTAVCAGQPIYLSDSGASFSSGISNQWQNSVNNGATWTAISGATTSSYTATLAKTTLFRYVTTCANSGDTAISNIVKVGVTNVLYCTYCSPNNGLTLHVGTTPSIDSVAITGTSLNNSSPGETINGYSYFKPSSNTTTTLSQGSTYNLVTKFSGPAISIVWFDWNQDGVYDIDEFNYITTNGSGTITTQIRVPIIANLGVIGMRIRSKTAGTICRPQDACDIFGSGETEEYFLNIVSPLPIKLASFTGKHESIGNVLSWTTLGEQNNTGFKVERSFDGKNFTEVGFVKTNALNGNSSESINYQFTDEKPFNNSYYRLRQIDKDGKESYSKIIMVKMLNAYELSLMSLYPNPAKNSINLVISGKVDENLTIVETDFAGKIVKTQHLILSSTNNIITLDIGTLTSGNYLLKASVKEGTNSAYGKFFKQ